MRKLIVTSVALCAAALATQAIAQAPPAPAAAPPPAYGEMINLEQAKKAAAAAQEFAAKNGWAMAISVAAPSGDLVRPLPAGRARPGHLEVEEELLDVMLDAVRASERCVSRLRGGQEDRV